MTLSEAAHKVIDLARKVRDYYATELPKRHPHYPLVGLDEESAPSPPAEKELRAFLASLSEEMVYQLMLIMYLGRGDFGVEDLAGYYEALKGTLGDPEHAASQMTDKAPLGDYLSDGLQELREHKIDVDKMPLKRVKLRKR
ncbi:MAG: DUF3775 domain-containing protein [Isosphaerales bacterium]